MHLVIAYPVPIATHCRWVLCLRSDVPGFGICWS